MTSPHRVLIADDQPEIREGFRQIVDSHPELAVVGEAADGEAALKQIDLLNPDVVLADIRMPGMDGLELCHRLRGHPRARVVVVTTFDNDEYVSQALHNGAYGFLLKRASPQLIVEAIFAAVAGDTLISPEMTVRLLSSARTNPMHPANPVAQMLTPREEDVVRLVAVGRTNVEIGRELFITTGTVKTHLANIQAKIRVTNRVGIAAWAWAAGLLQASDWHDRLR